VNVYRKFGFNVPVGALLDQYNYIPIAAALGASRLAEYQQHYHAQAAPVLEWYDGYPELSDEEIMRSWTEGNSFDDDGADFETKLMHRAAKLKAKCRAVLILFSYGAVPHCLKTEKGKAMVSMLTLDPASEMR
jgi:hypothetical protein